VTFQTFVQSDEKTWNDQKKLTKTNTKTKTMTMTMTKTCWEHILRAILDSWRLVTFETCVQSDEKTKTKTSNPRNLWHLRHWVQFWQLRTWIHDNLCYLTINSDTGQHSQFLRCFIATRLWPAFGRQSLVGSSGGYTSHGYTSHASPRACGARLSLVQSVKKWEKRNFSCL